MAIDVRLIGIFDPVPLGPRALDAARAAEAGGITILQLRMKHSGAGEILRWAERLARTLSLPVWLNDRADVAWLAGAAGVHLGAEDLPPKRVRRLVKPPFGIGVSVGNAREAETALLASVDYWSLGPVYATASKADAGRPLGPPGFAALAARAPRGLPCVAIGGITADGAREICATGAAGVAAIQAIFGAPDIERAARALREAVDASRS